MFLSPRSFCIFLNNNQFQDHSKIQVQPSLISSHRPVLSIINGPVSSCFKVQSGCSLLSLCSGAIRIPSTATAGPQSGVSSRIHEIGAWCKKSLPRSFFHVNADSFLGLLSSQYTNSNSDCEIGAQSINKPPKGFSCPFSLGSLSEREGSEVGGHGCQIPHVLSRFHERVYPVHAMPPLPRAVAS